MKMDISFRRPLLSLIWTPKSLMTGFLLGDGEEETMRAPKATHVLLLPMVILKNRLMSSLDGGCTTSC